MLGDHFVGAGYGIAAVAGTPSLTVPMGESHGLPLGLTFMGRAYSEGELIAVRLRVRAGDEGTQGSRLQGDGTLVSCRRRTRDA